MSDAENEILGMSDATKVVSTIASLTIRNLCAARDVLQYTITAKMTGDTDEELAETLRTKGLVRLEARPEDILAAATLLVVLLPDVAWTVQQVADGLFLEESAVQEVWDDVQTRKEETLAHIVASANDQVHDEVPT